MVAVVGPTASGKSGLAVEICKSFNGEVVSCDSMQIYKKMNIGTAKPTECEMEGVMHHLIDVVLPTETFTVSQYKSLAEPIISKLHEQNKIPVVCGGTGLATA